MTTPADLRASVRPGDVLVGKYRVERVLGAGGMGVVVAAHHIQLDQKVALKFLLPEALESTEAVGRFIREARAAVRITGEHVARVSDVGQLDTGSPYIVMEYLEGLDLSGWLKQRGALPIELAVDFVLQTCEAIAEAHALGIVHRDLKPANLFCIRRPDGQLSIKVLDFGISKVTTGSGADLAMTRTTAVIGSPLYMSPEQMQASRGVDVRTDIWSLGVILFELMTGRPPFRADAVTELAILIAVAPTPPVRSLRPDVPLGLERAVETCLEKDRERRFQTVGDLAIALKDFGSKRSRASVERVLGTLQTAGMTGVALPSSGEFHAATAVPQPSPPITPATVASWGRTRGAGSAQAKSSAAPTVAAVVGIAVLATAVTVATVLSRRTSTPTAWPVAGIAVPSQRAADPAPAATAGQSASSTVPPATPPKISSSAPAAPVGASAQSAAGPTAQPAPQDARPHHSPAAGPPTSTPAPAPKCDPPYFTDTAGHRRYKPECL